ncbi:NHLP bacteriocin export ABC transporter permease/ATPase subunit [Bullifex porci]|uniref:NHLP bacteriocin export ABC transporter permease/ATPase subunit n=1 Tax=Bullifex porci TaxID=2606638 RepID=UPI0023F0A23F|nr:NHLP bacteriocin export ABC transporter permease/ATPase subunit [Bullifex porci]MDD7256573.1 NHLP bacteriocin export ABC transporter permease/ATPase subunit [Bullifex porci]MDY2742196.1 NHLP bacteriocin export ABC transporter permease/ATPase subunit [Bullifex porci]
MGWFDEQIKERKQNDDAVFAAAFAGIADAVLGKKLSFAFESDAQKAKNAIDSILSFYHVKTQEVPDSIKNLNEQLEYLMRPYGIMRRRVKLEKGWYKNAIGAMLGVKKADSSVVAFIPTGLSGYSYLDQGSGKYVKINKNNEDLFEDEALAFYKPFPIEKLNIPILLRYIMEILSVSDFVLIGLGTLAVTLVGLLTPKLNNLLMGTVVDTGSMRLLTAIILFMVCVNIASLLLSTVKSLLTTRINTKLDITVQAATMARVMSLPADFFKSYSSGDLSSRCGQMNSLCNMLVSAILSTGLTSVFSLIYITQIFKYAPALVIPALSIIIATILFTTLTAIAQMKLAKKQMEAGAKEYGMSYALISGIQKIKLSGAEKRAFARWANVYTQRAKLTYNPPTFLKYSSVFSMAISLIGTILMYYFAANSHVSVADYYAFNTAYGMVSGAFMSLASIALTAANIKPILDMAKPIMDTVPEISADKQVVTRISGGIELNNISFRYNESMPNVLDNLSLKIKPGQYVAIVGTTGCGKSTLMRIMLGFETPQKGAVYYDGKDLSRMDLKSLRRKIGVVMQNGKLFQGDIFSNITISAPWLTIDDAWRAAELAGIADDIKRMPMGMHTIISEGSGGVSGGQRQRLMIARAIAPKPRILMFDEATSALDNLTQKKVSESLDGLKCTRIVIAHRLSTIKQCDRIIYLDNGKIVEDGTYEELINMGGKFAELVARQQLDSKG